MSVFVALNVGSIPAWAGETFSSRPRLPQGEVYPRVGGGNRVQAAGGRAEKGLSPRGRGKRLAHGVAQTRLRSIPAWAGETSRSADSAPASPVYPRVGGGNDESHEIGRAGSGLSPRGRGKPKAVRRGYTRAGSIPAWAGETLRSPDAARSPAVYPRVGGGNHKRLDKCIYYVGLSPRGRGKLGFCPSNRVKVRSIPAWAGETLRQAFLTALRTVYPRVGGGNSLGMSRTQRHQGLSPRGRGKRGNAACSRQRLRSIPAWAGETRRRQWREHAAWVYPRVGGGNAIRLA